MPGALKETFVGAGARWAMLLSDFPLATHVEEWIEDVTVSDVPKAFWPPGKPAGVCRCTLNFGPGQAQKPIVVYRFPDVKGQGGANAATEYHPTGWESLCTKTLGRALKEAGYPQDSKEIQLWLLFRRRLGELDAVRRGIIPAPLASRPDDDAKVIDAAAGPEDEEVIPPTPELLARLDAVRGDNLVKLSKFLTDRDWTTDMLGDPGRAKVVNAMLDGFDKAAAAPAPQPVTQTLDARGHAGVKVDATAVGAPPPVASEASRPAPTAGINLVTGRVGTLNAAQRKRLHDEMAFLKIPSDTATWMVADIDAVEAIIDEILADGPDHEPPPADRLTEQQIKSMSFRDVAKHLADRDLPTSGGMEACRKRLIEAVFAEAPL
jgi:hypothetical protein